jgi:hypothetical protein
MKQLNDILEDKKGILHHEPGLALRILLVPMIEIVI